MKYALVILAAVALLGFSTPALADDDGPDHETHVALHGDGVDSGARVGHTIRWPSGLTAVVNVNGHCVVGDPSEDDCSFGNLDLSGLSSADIGGGYTHSFGGVDVSALVDVSYAESDLSVGAELRAGRGSFFAFGRYGDLTDSLGSATEESLLSLKGFKVGVGFTHSF